MVSQDVLVQSSSPTQRSDIDLKTMNMEQEMNMVNAIRCLSAAMPTQAKSGHPGAPIGCAPMVHALYAHIMRYCPKDDKFLGRDRFVLSNGHACALLYTMLHLATEHLTLEDLKQFRQWGSLTPGHPEANHTKGVEVTTGPLGQGIAQAVGIAMGQHQWFEKYGTLFDNYTFCIVGDGCLMEGISGEASSLAGHLGLGRLICLFDSNSISIDGSTELAFSEDVAKRYEAYGFQVLKVECGDLGFESILETIEEAKRDLTRPSMIIVTTTIGFETNLAGTAKVHGAPLPKEELCNLRNKFGLKGDDIFDVGTEIYDYYMTVKKKNSSRASAWNSEYAALDATLRKEIENRIHFDPEQIMAALPTYTSDSKPTPTRTLSGEVLNSILPKMPGLIGGSADLTPSNMTALKGIVDFSKVNRSGRYIRFGVREHAMMAICNGLYAHGGFQPFSATFMIFLSYAYPALRLCALSKFSQMFIATHDSIELGEDGPTHQPVEMIPLVRALPNCVLIRPCDGNETAGAYAAWAKNQTRPCVASLSRGNVVHFNESSIEKTLKGAYILKDFNDKSDLPKVILAASGAEVQLAVDAKAIIDNTYNCRVVSFPSWELFEEQSDDYKMSVFPNDVKKGYVEASSGLGFERYFDLQGCTYMEGFGASAPKSKLFEEFGFTPEKIASNIVKMMKSE